VWLRKNKVTLRRSRKSLTATGEYLEYLSSGKDVHLGWLRAHCAMPNDRWYEFNALALGGGCYTDTARGWVSERWQLHRRQSGASCHTAVCLGQLSLLPPAGRKILYLVLAMVRRHSVADCDGAIGAPLIQLSVSESNRWRLHNALQCNTISSCKSPATSEIVMRFWSRVWLM